MLIYIDYDKDIFSKKEAVYLSKEFESIINKTSKVENRIPTYTSAYEITHHIYPIEVFIKISKKYLDGKGTLIKELKSEFQDWKIKNNFHHKINLTIIPMNWELALDI